MSRSMTARHYADASPFYALAQHSPAAHESRGFGGAPRVDPWFFSRFGDAGDAALFGCDLEISRRYGASNGGAAELVRAETLAMDSAAPGAYDLGTVSASDPAGALLEIADIAGMVRRRGGIPALVACDHTASLAGLIGSVRDGGAAPVFVYFDAHFDLGRNCAPGDLLHNGGFVGEILKGGWASCAVNVGGRSAATQLSFPDTPRFIGIPCYRSADAIVESLAPLAGQPLYVSIDADVLDPGLVPNVPCPEPDGMSTETLLSCCRWLSRHCEVVGADLTEIPPAAGHSDVEQHLMTCLLALTKH